MKQMINYKRAELRNRFAKRVAQGGLFGSVLAAGASFAQDAGDAASTAVTAINTGKTGITSVQGAMIGALVLLVVFALIRRSFGK